MKLAKLTNFDLVDFPVGCGRVFEAHRNIEIKVGKVGQVPYFIGFFAGLKLANLANFDRVGFLVGCGRVFEAHRTIKKKLAKLAKFRIS